MDVLPFLPAHFSSPDLLRRLFSSQPISALLHPEDGDGEKGWPKRPDLNLQRNSAYLSPFSALSSPAPSVLCVLHKHTSHLPPWHHSMLQTHHTSSLCCVLQPSAEPSQLQDDHMHAFCVSCFPLCSFSDNTLSLLIHPSIHLKPNIQPPTHHRTFRKQKMGRTWSNMPVAALTKYLFFPTNILKFF